MKSGLPAIAVSLLQFTSPVLSDEEVLLLKGDLMTRPTLIYSEPTEYKRFIREREVEGWVTVEVTVGIDGKAFNARVIESSIPGVFDEAAIKIVTGYTYEPATLNGKPVEDQVETRQVFLLEDKRDAVSEAFFRRGRGISRALSEGDLETAWKKIEKLEKKRQRMLAELAYLDLYKSVYYRKSGDPEQALESINRALIVADDGVSRLGQSEMLRSAMQLNADLKYYATALQRYRQLEELLGSLPEDDPATKLAMSIKSTIAGDGLLVSEAVLEPCNGCEDESFTWEARPVRKRFRVTDVPGSVSEARLRCGSIVEDFQLQNDKTYVIHVLSDDCHLRVKGEQAARFSFVELPANG